MNARNISARRSCVEFDLQRIQSVTQSPSPPGMPGMIIPPQQDKILSSHTPKYSSGELDASGEGPAMLDGSSSTKVENPRSFDPIFLSEGNNSFNAGFASVGLFDDSIGSSKEFS
jgi:hypothetical protein